MKVSCLPVSFFNDIQSGAMSLHDWAAMARDAGLDAIDLSTLLIRNHSPVYLRRIRDELEQENMPVVMITSYPDFTHPDRQQRKREFEYARYDIAVASELGAKYLRVTAGQAHPQTSRDHGIAWVVEHFKRIDEVAGEFGVQLLFENHSKPGAWQHSDFSHPTGIFLEIFEALRDTNIGVNFDTANTLVYGDDPIPVLERVMKRVVTVHAADTAVQGQLKPVLLGTGIVPFDAIFSVLRGNAFDGWLCIEEASNLGRAGVIDAVKFVRSAWERVLTSSTKGKGAS
jgi:sugar phosphate isomerase/epimerase